MKRSWGRAFTGGGVGSIDSGTAYAAQAGLGGAGGVVAQDDLIYANLTCINSGLNVPGTSLGPPVNFLESRAVNILDNCSDYMMSIIRWTSTGLELPLFIPAIDSVGTDPNRTTYQIGMTVYTPPQSTTSFATAPGAIGYVSSSTPGPNYTLVLANTGPGGVGQITMQVYATVLPTVALGDSFYISNVPATMTTTGLPQNTTVAGFDAAIGDKEFEVVGINGSTYTLQAPTAFPDELVNSTYNTYATSVWIPSGPWPITGLPMTSQGPTQATSNDIALGVVDCATQTLYVLAQDSIINSSTSAYWTSPTTFASDLQNALNRMLSNVSGPGAKLFASSGAVVTAGPGTMTTTFAPYLSYVMPTKLVQTTVVTTTSIVQAPATNPTGLYANLLMGSADALSLYNSVGWVGTLAGGTIVSGWNDALVGNWMITGVNSTAPYGVSMVYVSGSSSPGPRGWPAPLPTTSITNVYPPTWTVGTSVTTFTFTLSTTAAAAKVFTGNKITIAGMTSKTDTISIALTATTTTTSANTVYFTVDTGAPGYSSLAIGLTAYIYGASGWTGLNNASGKISSILGASIGITYLVLPSGSGSVSGGSIYFSNPGSSFNFNGTYTIGTVSGSTFTITYGTGTSDQGSRLALGTATPTWAGALDGMTFTTWPANPFVTTNNPYKMMLLFAPRGNGVTGAPSGAVLTGFCNLVKPLNTQYDFQFLVNGTNPDNGPPFDASLLGFNTVSYPPTITSSTAGTITLTAEQTGTFATGGLPYFDPTAIAGNWAPVCKPGLLTATLTTGSTQVNPTTNTYGMSADLTASVTPGMVCQMSSFGTVPTLNSYCVVVSITSSTVTVQYPYTVPTPSLSVGNFQAFKTITLYAATGAYDPYVFTRTLEWVPQYPGDPVPLAPSQNNGNIDVKQGSRYYWATDPQHVLDMVNAGLKDIWYSVIQNANSDLLNLKATSTALPTLTAGTYPTPPSVTFAVNDATRFQVGLSPIVAAASGTNLFGLTTVPQQSTYTVPSGSVPNLFPGLGTVSGTGYGLCSGLIVNPTTTQVRYGFVTTSGTFAVGQLIVLHIITGSYPTVNDVQGTVVAYLSGSPNLVTVEYGFPVGTYTLGSISNAVLYASNVNSVVFPMTNTSGYAVGTYVNVNTQSNSVLNTTVSKYAVVTAVSAGTSITLGYTQYLLQTTTITTGTATLNAALQSATITAVTPQSITLKYSAWVPQQTLTGASNGATISVNFPGFGNANGSNVLLNNAAPAFRWTGPDSIVLTYPANDFTFKGWNSGFGPSQSTILNADAVPGFGSYMYSIQMNPALYALFRGFPATFSLPIASASNLLASAPYPTSEWNLTDNEGAAASPQGVYTLTPPSLTDVVSQCAGTAINAWTMINVPQQGSCTDNWAAVSALSFHSALPIVPEDESAPAYASSEFSPSTSQDVVTSMTDVQLDLAGGVTDWLSKVNYAPTAQYRWTLLRGGPIQNITFSVYWKHRATGRRYLATLAPNGSVEVKLLFQKRRR